MEFSRINIDGQKYYDDKPFPLCMSPSSAVRLDSVVSWIEANRDYLDNLLREYKAVFFRNCGIQSAQDFDRIVEATGLKEMAYVGGAAVRTVVTPRVFTSNESPPSEKIPFHHEMAQVPQPPTHLFFYCEVPSQVGGETPLLPSHEVYTRMTERFPEFMQKVETLGVQYIRVMPSEDDPSSAIGRSWKSTFLTESKDEAEAKLRELGSTWEWLDNGDLRTITAVVPAIRTDTGPNRTGEKTFFNSMVAAYTGWNDTRNTGREAVRLGDGSPCDEEAMNAAVEIMDEVAAVIRWQAGDFVLIDNRTVMHSRKPFEGKRRVLASLIQDPPR